MQLNACIADAMSRNERRGETPPPHTRSLATSASVVSFSYMKLRRVHSTIAVVFVLLSSEHLSAQANGSVGDASNALPGLRRVPLIGTVKSRRISATFDTGYGISESQHAEGFHHRMNGSFALGLSLVPGLEFGGAGAIRYDRHPKDELGRDTGTIGQASFVTRWGTQLSRAIFWGADLGATFPGSDRLGDSLKSPAVDLRTAFGWRPTVGPYYAGLLGFRFDNTASAGREADRYRLGDRLALGLSDYPAILVGVGVLAPVAPYELLGEISGDVLVLAGSPTVMQSPMRVDLGVRRTLSKHWFVELIGEVSLSQRPDVAPNAPLIPIEPRFYVGCGVRYRLEFFGNGQQAVPVKMASPVERKAQHASPVANVAESTGAPTSVEASGEPSVSTGQLSVTIFDHSGHPLSDATAKLVTDSGEVLLVFEQGATFGSDAIPIGRAELVVNAELMQEFRQSVEISKGQHLELRINLLAAELSGQLRGQVRSFDGKHLPAFVRIEPGDREVQADEEGTFRLDLKPGKYQVKVSLEGYKTQLRTVEVRKNGVMVLNVDLEKERR